MKNNLLICFICSVCFIIPGIVNAQTDARIRDAKNQATSAGLGHYRRFSNHDSICWIFGGDVSMGFNATQLSNWAGGGMDQIGINWASNVYANYKKGKRTVENYGTFAYGLLRKGEYKAIKNDDKIHIVSKIGHQMSQKWFYSAAFVARTQFTPGYKYSNNDTIRISDFLAPVTFFLSIGLDYRPHKTFTAMFSPIMGKATFANSDDLTVLSNAGVLRYEKDENGNDVPVKKKSRYEFGGGMLFTLNGNLLKNKVSYSSQLEFFSNYAESPLNVDIAWALRTRYQIYKNISAEIRLDIKYDDDQKTTDKETGERRGAKVQVNYFFGMGLFYQF